METTQLHLRINPGEAKLLDDLAGKSLKRQAVAQMLLTAAIDAVLKNQGKLTFPPCFEVADPIHPISRLELNEPRKIKRT